MDAIHALNRPRTLDLSAAGIAAGLCVLEIARLIATRGGPYEHTILSFVAGGGILVVVLAVAAVGLFLHRQDGYVAGVLAALVALGYGIFSRASGNLMGLLFMAGGAVLMGLLMKSLHWYRTEQLGELEGLVPARQRAHVRETRAIA